MRCFHNECLEDRVEGRYVRTNNWNYESFVKMNQYQDWFETKVAVIEVDSGIYRISQKLRIVVESKIMIIYSEPTKINCSWVQ